MRGGDAHGGKPGSAQRMQLADDTQNVFIVRIWHEPRENAGDTAFWRCSVEHVETRTVRHFQEMVTLTAFLARQAGIQE